MSDIVMRECGEHGLCGFCELHGDDGCGELYAEVLPAEILLLRPDPRVRRNPSEETHALDEDPLGEEDS